MPPPYDPSAELEPRTVTSSDDRLSDLDAYRRLICMSEHADALSNRCWGRSAATALKAASIVARSLASGLYRLRVLERPEE